MNIRTCFASLFLLAVLPVHAQQTVTSMPSVQAEATRIVFDCAARTLPSQRLVGELTGQHNFSQVYDTRQRLMVEVGHACQADGIQQVQLVLSERPADGQQPSRLVAVIEPLGR